MVNQGVVFDIQRFCLHDGPGIRTVVFLKGCPLRCLWCSNPESQNQYPEMFYIETKCIGCFRCREACPQGCIDTTDNQKIVIDRAKCLDCGTCASACYSGALTCKGKTYTIEEVMDNVIQDRAFYENTHGGVTLSGGEVLNQADFALGLLSELRRASIHTAIETTGYGDSGALLSLAETADLILYDVKHYDEQVHERFTGVSNQKIISNLDMLINEKKNNKIVVRIPIIPGFNADKKSLEGIRDLLKAIGVRKIELLPFHQLGKKKYEYLGRDYYFSNVDSLSDSEISHFKDDFKLSGFELYE